MKNSTLCMSRGGAAKQIPYVCHLCQKHSDDTACHNHTECGMCARICESGSCYHYPMMDSDAIKKIVDKKKRLDQKDEAQRVSLFVNNYMAAIGTHTMLPAIYIWSLLVTRSA
jgi:ferredoxin